MKDFFSPVSVEDCLAEGSNLRAAFGTVRTFFASATAISAVAVIPGRRLRSSFETSRSVL